MLQINKVMVTDSNYVEFVWKFLDGARKFIGI